MHYALYNNSNNKLLIHPKVGLWSTDDQKEAGDMLQACHDYLKSRNLNFMAGHISIVEIDKDFNIGKEINKQTSQEEV